MKTSFFLLLLLNILVSPHTEVREEKRGEKKKS